MSFDRFRTQVSCEAFKGCHSFADFYNLSYQDLENYSLSRADLSLYHAALKEDASDLFYKGLLSLTEGLNGYLKSQYSWSVVKCYYSVFYFLRAELALRDIGLIRHRSIYYLKAEEGAKPITKGRGGNNRTNYSGDHKATINYFIDLFSTADILLSQNIEGLNAYQWLMKKREQIHYQERHFNEPNFSDFLSFIDGEIRGGNFNRMINQVISDPFIKTFQPEYSSIAIPIKRAMLTLDNFYNSGYNINLDQPKLDFLKSISKINILNLWS